MAMQAVGVAKVGEKFTLHVPDFKHLPWWQYCPLLRVTQHVSSSVQIVYAFRAHFLHV